MFLLKNLNVFVGLNHSGEMLQYLSLVAYVLLAILPFLQFSEIGLSQIIQKKINKGGHKYNFVSEVFP